MAIFDTSDFLLLSLILPSPLAQFAFSLAHFAFSLAHFAISYNNKPGDGKVSQGEGK